MNHSVKFNATQNDFFTTLNRRVNAHFKTNGISRYANAAMVVKTIVMFSLYSIPYVLIVSGVTSNLFLFYILSAVMGTGLAGIGMSVMHDANHGAYSKTKWVNSVLGYSLNVVGGNAFNWKMQHNILHHTFTNVEGADEDIEPRGVMRFSPHTAWKPFHRFQFVYAWFFYGLLTFIWVVFKDYQRLLRYKRDGMLTKQKTTVGKQWLVLLSSKFAYYGYILLIPLIVLPFAWWHVVLGFFLMHFVAGFILAVIFQAAHIVEGTHYPLPDAAGNIHDTWAVHQLRTTANFAQDNKILSWYIGGLNYQVEHHLFSGICHVHYRALSGIVQATAEEFGHPYMAKETFAGAMASHLRILKAFGERSPVPSV